MENMLATSRREEKKKVGEKKERKNEREKEKERNDSNLILSFSCVRKSDFYPRIENETRKTKNNENLY